MIDTMRQAGFPPCAKPDQLKAFENLFACRSAAPRSPRSDVAEYSRGMGDDDEAPPRFASKAFPIVVYYAWLAEGIAMRVILCLGLLLSQILTASADSDPIPACKPDLQTMRFTAVTRYCVGSGRGEANGTTKTCNYDCLISSEAVSVPVQNDCPLTVKLRLFEDGSREVIEPIIPPSLDNAT